MSPAEEEQPHRQSTQVVPQLRIELASEQTRHGLRTEAALLALLRAEAAVIAAARRLPPSQ